KNVAYFRIGERARLPVQRRRHGHPQVADGRRRYPSGPGTGFHPASATEHACRLLVRLLALLLRLVHLEHCDGCSVESGRGLLLHAVQHQVLMAAVTASPLPLLSDHAKMSQITCPCTSVSRR